MKTIQCDVAVLGSGPGGYSAAFRAADLGLKVVLIEREPNLGGVCLNVGCIPSKALLHAAKVIDEAQHLEEAGISFGKPKIDIKALKKWKDAIVGRLTGGLKALAKQRKVEVVQGVGEFATAHSLNVKDANNATTVVEFKHAIIAAGSRPVVLPFLPQDPRIMDSTGALELQDIPGKMLVIGGGIIGLEMSQVYSTLGTQITVVELLDNLMPGVDKDLVAPFFKRVKARYENIYLQTKVTKVEAKKDGLWVTFEGNGPKEPQRFDRILSSVGRVPNGKLIAAEKAGVNVDERGFIAVDNQQRTNVAHIFAIGDICGNPMLAHKAIPEGRVAAEVISGMSHHTFEPRCIPNVAYTDPEVAWVGIDEAAAKAQGINYGKGVFPWAASGRSLSMGRNEGITKLLFDEDSGRIIGAGIVGPHAGDLIAEAALAIEMGCDAEDIALTIHPHPTLSETIAMATEVFEGTITDLYMPKKTVNKELEAAG